MAYLPESKSELEELIALAVKAHVPEAVAEGVRQALRKDYLRSSEVCAMTGWSPRKLAYLKAERKLPYVKRGGTLLFPTAGVEAYLEEALVPRRGDR